MKKIDILQAPCVKEMIETTANLYRLGWDERNGGNLSYLLKEEEITPFLDPKKVIRRLSMSFDARPLAGSYRNDSTHLALFRNFSYTHISNLHCPSPLVDYLTFMALAMSKISFL